MKIKHTITCAERRRTFEKGTGVSSKKAGRPAPPRSAGEHKAQRREPLQKKRQPILITFPPRPNSAKEKAAGSGLKSIYRDGRPAVPFPMVHMKYSLIMAVLNGGRFVQRALNSVLAQTWTDYEIIVQDGGSTDGTLDLLQPYARRIDLVSGPDGGVYDAWNKALERASGDWALFLGADDLLPAGDVLVKSAEYLARVPAHVEFVYGNLALGADGRPKTRISSSLASIYSQFFLGHGLPFSSTFVRLATAKGHGFDASYRIAGDLDLVSRRLGPDNVLHMPHYVTFMEHGGISDNPKYADVLLEERRRVLRTHIVPKAAMIAGACLKYLPGDPEPEGSL